jgi:hypothetical protein
MEAMVHLYIYQYLAGGKAKAQGQGCIAVNTIESKALAKRLG